MRAWGIATGATVVVLAGLGLAPNAGAAADTTGPKLSLQPIAHLVVPADVVNQFPANPFAQSLYESAAIQKWSASDPSGICDYQLYDNDGRDQPGLMYEGLNTTFRFAIGDVDEGDGGYNWYQFALRAKDCAGNWSDTSPDLKAMFPKDRYVPQSVERNATLAFDDNGVYVDDPGTTLPVTYSGAWASSKCVCFVRGTDRHTSTKGASVTFTYTGNVVGWVTPTGPGRGSARIYQDGVLKTTISTYATANTGARVMWSNWFATPGQHTIRIVVVGTSGHPRVDFDGFIVAPNPNAS
jgi:hypothetical protein